MNRISDADTVVVQVLPNPIYQTDRRPATARQDLPSKTHSRTRPQQPR